MKINVEFDLSREQVEFISCGEFPFDVENSCIQEKLKEMVKDYIKGATLRHLEKEMKKQGW